MLLFIIENVQSVQPQSNSERSIYLIRQIQQDRLTWRQYPFSLLFYLLWVYRIRHYLCVLFRTLPYSSVVKVPLLPWVYPPISSTLRVLLPILPSNRDFLFHLLFVYPYKVACLLKVYLLNPHALKGGFWVKYFRGFVFHVHLCCAVSAISTDFLLSL